MKLRARLLALPLALSLAGLGLASCANDPVALTRTDTQIGMDGDAPYYGYNSVFSDPYYYSDDWPFYSLGRFGGRHHFAGHGFHSMGRFHSGFHGHR